MMNINDNQKKILKEIKENCEKVNDCSGCPYEIYDIDLDEHICFFGLSPVFWRDIEDNED